MANLLENIVPGAYAKTGTYIVVIDYGLPNIFRIYLKNIHNYRVRINGEVEIFGSDYYSIDKKVEKAEYLNVIKGEINHYIDKGGNVVTVDEFKKIRNRISEESEYDHDLETYVYDTKEIKDLYLYSISLTPVYSPNTERWEDIEIVNVKKQFIDKEYEDYISSDINISFNSFSSICTYVRNRKLIATKILKEKGYLEKEIKSDEYIQKAYTSYRDAIWIHKGPKIENQSRGNNKYLSEKFVGSYEDCINEYKKDYDEILNSINEHQAKCTFEKLGADNLSSVINAINHILSQMNELEKCVKSTHAFKIINNTNKYLINFKKDLIDDNAKK